MKTRCIGPLHNKEHVYIGDVVFFKGSSDKEYGKIHKCIEVCMITAKPLYSECWYCFGNSAISDKGSSEKEQPPNAKHSFVPLSHPLRTQQPLNKGQNSYYICPKVSLAERLHCSYSYYITQVDGKLNVEAFRIYYEDHLSSYIVEDTDTSMVPCSKIKGVVQRVNFEKRKWRKVPFSQ